MVRAGLAPRLRAGAVPGSDRWLIATMFPGTQPFEAVAEALGGIAATGREDLWSVLADGERGLLDAVDLLLPDETVEVLLVIDQFEELFSSAVSEADRRRFLDALTTVATSEGRVRAVLTLRADYFDHPLSSPDFAAVFRDRIVAIGPPTVDGLARAVAQPAIRAGVSLEPGLTTRIIDDGRGQPAAALPLLQFALTELFERRDGDVMTLAGYEAIGGVGGALAKRAEQTWAGLTPARRRLARQLFLRLVSVDAVADDSRRRVALTELLGVDAEPGAMEELINRFGALRFLSFDRDPASRAPTVELAHEALLHRWKRLASWVDEQREDLLIHRRLQVVVADWLAGDEDPSFLLRGNRLDQTRAWLDRTDLGVSDDERRLVDASIEAERQRIETQDRLDRLANRRRRMVLAAVAVAAAVASVMGAFALRQRGQAVASAEDATRRELALASLTIVDDDPEVATLLALEALDVGDQNGSDPLPEVLGALWSGHVANRVELAVDGVGLGGVAYHPEATMLAVDAAAGSDGLVSLRDADTGAELVRLPSRPAVAPGLVESMAFSPDGSLLFVGRNPSAANPTPVLEVFDVAAGALAAQVTLHGHRMLELDVSQSGLVAAFTFIEGGTHVTMYDSADDTVANRLTDADVGGAIASINGSFRPGRDELAISVANGEKARVVIVDARSGAALDGFEVTGRPWFVAFDPMGARLAAGDTTVDAVVVHDVASGEPLFPPAPHPDPQDLGWSPDGTLVAVAGNESDVTLLEANTGRTTLLLSGHKASIWSTDFHPRGDRLASVSADGSLRVWDTTASGPAGLADGLGNLSRLDAGPELVMVGVVGDGLHVLDAATGELIHHHDELLVAGNDSAKGAGSAGLVAGLRHDMTGVVADARTGTTVAELPPCTLASGFSADGRYVGLDFVGPGADDNPTACDEAGTSGILDLQTGELVIDRTGAFVPWTSISGPDTFDRRRYAALTSWPAVDVTQVEIFALEPTELLATLTVDELGVDPFLLPSFSADARYLGVGVNGPSAVVVDVEALSAGASVTQATLFNKEVHTGNTPEVLVTPDGLVATAAFDGWYRLWDLETGDLRFEVEVDGLQGHPALAFSPDHRTFYYEDGNGVLRAMPTDVDELTELARASVTRALTDDECTRYLHTDGCLDR